jgi:leucyl-tRNA synthetase
MPINWCPHCKSGLALEEVTAENIHERCGTKVTKKMLTQWLLKITAYADRLIEDLNTVDYTSDIKQQQINWIGRSEGARILFPIVGSDHRIEVFTTRADTLPGATYMVLAPEHGLQNLSVHKSKKKRQGCLLAHTQRIRLQMNRFRFGSRIMY